MRLILTFLAILMSGSLAANALTIDYNFKNQEECTNPNHTEYTDLMMTNQGKLAEIILQPDVLTFYHSWAEALQRQYDGKGSDADTIFVFKSYPQAGLIFAYNDGCLLGARVFPLDLVNKILEIYVTKKKTGDL
jgi:hypothetical protein